MHALAEGDFAKAEAAAKRAHDLIQNTDLEKLIQTLGEQKKASESKQSALFE